MMTYQQTHIKSKQHNLVRWMGIELIKKRNVIEHEIFIHWFLLNACCSWSIEVRWTTEKKHNVIEHAFGISVHVTSSVLQ